MIVRHLTVACVQSSTIYDLGFAYVGAYIYIYVHISTDTELIKPKLANLGSNFKLLCHK